MEYQHQDDSIFSLEVTPTLHGNLLEAVKWGKFLAIMGFIGTGFLVLAGIGMGALSSRLGDSSGYSSLIGIGGMFGYLAIAALYFYPAFAMFKFCTLTRQGLQASNQPLFEEGIAYLKRLLRYMGILTIVLIALYIVAIFFMVTAKL
jgi:hypothetical protein